MLLCLVMMMSLCTAAFAAGTDTTDYCDCDPSVYNPFPEDNEDGTTHHFICTVCKKRVPMKDEAHTWDCNELGKYVGEGGTTCLCGAKKPHYVIVSYDVKDGTPIGETRVLVKETATSGSTITFKTATTTTKVGYTLAGWTKGTTEYAVGEEVTLKVKANTVKITLTAKWDECKHGDTAMWSNIPVDGTHHKTVCKVCNAYVSDKLLECIFKDGKCDCGNEEPVATKTYKVEYVRDADKLVPATKMPVDSTEYAIGDKVTLKKMALTDIPEGYTFVGWSDGLKIYQPDDVVPVGGNMKFTLVLEKVPATTFTVTYVAGDTGVNKNGLPVDNTKYVANDVAVIKNMPATTIPEGKIFAGWTDGTTTYPAGTRVVMTGNLVLTPVLVEKSETATYKVTYVAGDTGVNKNGLPVDDAEYAIGDMAVIKKMPATTIPEGYAFIGWTDGKVIYPAGMRVVITGNLELTPVLCNHSELTYVNNQNGKNGTHNATCDKCGALVVDHEKHVFKGNKCTLCGARKSAPSGGSTTGTTTATTKSPKTGDMGVVLYAATALLSLSGTAVVIKKRKNDK